MKPTLRPVLAILPVLVCALITSQCAAKAETYTVTVERWADADTVVAKHCHGTYCVLERIRLRSFDAPEVAHTKNEVDQPGGKEALAYVNANYGKGVKLTVSPKGGLSFGRVVADVKAGDTDVACDLAAHGHGMVDPRYSPSDELKAAQAKAAEAGLGIWKEKDPVPPWDWRKQNKSKLIELRKK